MMGLRHQRMNPNLAAILGARKKEAWGRPPLKSKNVPGAIDKKPSSMMDQGWGHVQIPVALT
jgi:hypothetical protein